MKRTMMVDPYYMKRETLKGSSTKGKLDRICALNAMGNYFEEQQNINNKRQKVSYKNIL